MLVSYCANFAPQGQNSRLCAAARRSHCSHSQYHSCSNYCSRLNTIPVPTQVIMLVSYCANFAPQGQNSRLCAAARRSYCSHSPLCSLVKPLLIPPFPQPVDPLPPPSNSHPHKISKIENSKIIFSKFRYFSEFCSS